MFFKKAVTLLLQLFLLDKDHDHLGFKGVFDMKININRIFKHRVNPSTI